MNMALRNVGNILKLNKNVGILSASTCHASTGGSSTSTDPVTHTGQQFDPNDYRLVRFVDKKKHVNTKWAAKLIAEVPPKHVTARVVSCDGGGGPTGHPKIYINLDKPGDHSCTYCGLRFVKPDHH